MAPWLWHDKGYFGVNNNVVYCTFLTKLCSFDQYLRWINSMPISLFYRKYEGVPGSNDA
jgi:hypothetical protein